LRRAHLRRVANGRLGTHRRRDDASQTRPCPGCVPSPSASPSVTRMARGERGRGSRRISYPRGSWRAGSRLEEDFLPSRLVASGVAARGGIPTLEARGERGRGSRRNSYPRGSWRAGSRLEEDFLPSRLVASGVAARGGFPTLEARGERGRGSRRISYPRGKCRLLRDPTLKSGREYRWGLPNAFSFVTRRSRAVENTGGGTDRLIGLGTWA
jgi:hypothetical protein